MVMDEEHETSKVINGGRHTSPIVMITNLGGGLPDPIENSSEDYDESVDRGSSKSVGPPSKTIGPKNHVQNLVPSKPRNLLGEASSVPRSSDHISGEESAGFLNNFINVPHGTSKAASSSSSGTPRVSRLKRISKADGPNYRGINASKGTQRRMNSRPVNIFDFDDANSQLLVNKRPVIRPPSVDPGSIDWQTQDTLGRKKRKLNATSKSGHVADPGVTAVQAAPTADEIVPSSQVPSLGKRGPPKVLKRGRGRPPKSRPEDDVPVENVVPNILPGSENALPHSVSDPQTNPIANPDMVVGPTSTNGKAVDKPQSPVIHSPGASKLQEKSSTGKKRGRPPKSRPNNGEPVDSTAQNKIPRRPSGKRVGRPRKSGTEDNRPTVVADPEEEPEHTTKERPSDLVEDVPPQTNILSTGGEGQPSSHHVVDQGRGSKSPNSVQDAQESNSPPPVSANNISNEASPQASQNEETAVATRPDVDDSIDRQTTRPPPNETPADQVEPSTNGAQNTAQWDQPDGPADEPGSGESDQEPQRVPSESSLSKAFKAAIDIGQKRQRHAVSSPMSKLAREVLQACTDMRTCMSEIEAADEDDISALSAELQTLTSEVSEKSRGLVLESGWNENGARIHAIFMHILPKLTVLLKHLLRHFGCGIGGLSCQQLRTTRILITAIVELGSKVKPVRPEVEFEFAVVRVVKQVIVKGVEKALGDVQSRIRKIRDARQAAERAERQREEQRLREQEEISSERRMMTLEEWKAKWDSLHSERTIAELNGKSFLSRSKQNHLRSVPLELDEVELDGNGDPIERVQLFRQRTSRPPGQSGHVQPWAIQDHVYALAKGLQQFLGPRVYQKIFWKYCQQGKPLCDYNVSEIVDQAMWLRQEMIKDAEEIGNEPAGWVLQICDPRVPPGVDDA